jgi:hypothetical protein
MTDEKKQPEEVVGIPGHINSVKKTCAIVQDRYHGVYSGAEWTAWPMNSENVPTEISGDDVSCAEFWNQFTGIVGKGDTKHEALDDLCSKLGGGY